MKYTVVSRNPNTWVRTPTRDVHEIIYSCGHQHRSLSRAVQCLDSIRNTTAGLNARVETYAKDQMFDGQRVNKEDIYRAMGGR